MLRSSTILFLCLFFVCLAMVHGKIELKTATGIWLFDEGKGKIANDLSGHQGGGKLEKGPKWVKGKFGQAIEFDGKDDYVQIPPSDQYNPKNANGDYEFTISFWMYPHEVGGNNPAGKGSATLVIANGDPGDGGGANWWFEYWNPGNFEFKSCQAGCSGASIPLPEPKKWYFVSGIYNGKEYELYIDGEFKSKGVNAIGTPAKGLLIGSGLCPAGHGCDGGYFKGIIDDVSMFNTKLSEADLKKLMNDGVGASLGLLAVQGRGKLAIQWSSLKQP